FNQVSCASEADTPRRISYPKTTGHLLSFCQYVRTNGPTAAGGKHVQIQNHFVNGALVYSFISIGSSRPGSEGQRGQERQGALHRHRYTSIMARANRYCLAGSVSWRRRPSHET